MNFYLPENLDLDSLIRNNPPNFKNFKRDKLRYFLHLINAIALLNKDKLYDEYTCINAKALQTIIQNYKQYVSYVIEDLQIVECDNHYIPGEKSLGYKFIDKYQTDLICVEVQEFTLRKCLKVAKNRRDASVKQLSFLTKFFDDSKLKIDLEKVNEFLETERNLKLLHSHLVDRDFKTQKPKDPQTQYNHSKMSAERLSQGQYHLNRDENVYRFHSNLTNMRSMIRNAITYDGQKLIAVDIKNSQPYLSTLLLTNTFWAVEKNEASINLPQSLSFYKPNMLSLSNKERVFSISNIDISKRDSYIMIGEIPQLLIDKEFNAYINLVVKGQLYEFLKTHFQMETGLDFMNRKEVKKAVFQVLFTDNRYIGQETAKPKRLFKKLFPEVYKVFSAIKREDKTLLPRLLQSIESYLMVNIIAKRISIEYPNAPIYTIHDSITTTAEYIDNVERIMNEELTKAIGYAPTLDRQYWDTANMDKYINSLHERARKVA
jgi:hypothetical protein